MWEASLPHFKMSFLDLVVLAAYLVVILAIGAWVSRRKATAESFFLASREATWPIIGLSLLASNISSTTMIGLAGAAYAIGISVYNYEWMAGVVLVFFCAFFLPIILKSAVYTMPEFLERRYDLATRLYFSGLTIFLNIVVDTAGTLFGGSMMFKLLYPDLPLWEIAAILTLCSGVYTIAGGLKAIMTTEVIQAIVLLCSSAFVAMFAFQRAGGLMHVLHVLPHAKLSLIRPLNEAGVPWVGLVTGVPLIGFYFWCTNQFMVQRILSAKSLDHGRWGSLFAGLLKLPVLFLMVLPGSAALLLYPHLTKPDMVYPTLVFSLLPVGVVGLITAAFLGAIMSATASTFNSASTLVTMDFVARFRPHTTPGQLVAIGRISTLGFMILAIAWVPIVERVSTTLWQYLQAILAYAVPPIVALFFGGVFSSRVNATGAKAALVLGILCGALLFALGPVTHVFPIHFLIAAALIFAAALGALIVASHWGSPPVAEQVEPLVWRPALWTAESATLVGRPFWQNYRVLSLALLSATAVLVWLFR
jgi:SSS family solute:Na+ symporter